MTVAFRREERAAAGEARHNPEIPSTHGRRRACRIRADPSSMFQLDASGKVTGLHWSSRPQAAASHAAAKVAAIVPSKAGISTRRHDQRRDSRVLPRRGRHAGAHAGAAACAARRSATGRKAHRASHPSTVKDPAVGVVLESRRVRSAALRRSQTMPTTAAASSMRCTQRAGGEFHATVANELGSSTSSSGRRVVHPAAGAMARRSSARLLRHTSRRCSRSQDLEDRPRVLPRSDPMHLAALKRRRKRARSLHRGAGNWRCRIPATRSGHAERADRLHRCRHDMAIAMSRAILPLAMSGRSPNGVLPIRQQRRRELRERQHCSRASATALPGGPPIRRDEWAHFFLKYVISHPAVTVARVARPSRTTCSTTWVAAWAGCERSTAAHGGVHRLGALVTMTIRNQQWTNRFDRALAAVLDRYWVTTARGRKHADLRRYGRCGAGRTNPDRVIYGQTETASGGRDVIEFQLDSTGKATGLTYEQRGQKISAARIR